MKARRGFVSNSSSSSFVLVVERGVHEAILPGLHPYARAVVEAHAKEGACLGRPCLVISSCHGNGGSHFERDDTDFDGEQPKDEDGCEMGAYGAIMAYKEAAYKVGPDKVFYEEADGGG